ncbi:unnamed protein product [Effrenium voratum]|uniref:Uncharacterized protein n=1 Tax=Effrenium voratum TaxID=2562239 RepID=A0AA36NCV1_9DINO|nr:unnamed protein product [Effrenium voratum]
MLKYQQNLEKEAFPPEQHAAGGPLDSQAAASGRPGQRRVRSPGRDDSAEDDSYFESLDDDPDEEPSNGQEKSPPAEAGAAGLPGLLGGYADEARPVRTVRTRRRSRRARIRRSPWATSPSGLARRSLKRPRRSQVSDA